MTDIHMTNIYKLQLTVLINYTAVGSIIGFVQGGIATVLRQQGVSLNSMAWVFALYLPFGLAFLWSPWLDRLKPHYGFRRQILTAQVLACVLLLAMAVISRHDRYFPLLWGMALVLNIAIACLDLALDGLSSLSCNDKSRHSIASAKVAGMSLGVLVGGGLLVGQFVVLGWSGVFAVIAAILLLAMPFMRLLDEPPPQNDCHQGLGLRVCWQDKTFRSRLWRLALFSCCLMALFNLNRLLLVDMGIPLKTIGLYLGTATPLGSLVVALLLPVLMRRFSYGLIFIAVGGGLLLAVLALIGVISLDYKGVALGLSIVIGIACSAWLLISGSIILDWAKSGQSATDYALLYGVGRLFGIGLLIVLPTAIARLGWQNYYAIMAGLFLLAMVLLYACVAQKNE